MEEMIIHGFFELKLSDKYWKSTFEALLHITFQTIFLLFKRLKRKSRKIFFLKALLARVPVKFDPMLGEVTRVWLV